ncbi:alpha/beta fold hydrolase [Nocardia sp. NBC_00565]|uniref:thioesterase II family protein n=1 Tax=Nocardia sp. NBC_00565 TaxID=2975993 RepID=UPI002E818AC8|nr:alpha/beta fold hydrolase [Nocardia sp. NBC_00565]WUC06981.1 alpha/beta fold hydrolase [Nocardia sp. NBC_00565]
MGRAIVGTDWLRVLRAHSAPRHQLLCFPPGGGAVTVYRALAERIDGGVAVVAVQYPGRQDRLGEPAIDDMDALVDRIVEEVLDQGPVQQLSLFGHSMGATVAFETARRLERKGQPITTLFVSGRPAPTFVEERRLHLGSDDDLIGDLERLATDPASVKILRDEPGLAELVLPAVRSDYQAIETYRYREGAPLSCDVSVLVSTDDPTMTPGQGEQWREHTSGAFEHAVFPGGHFYLDDKVAEVADLIARTLHT